MFDLEVRTLSVILHYQKNISSFFKTRGKRRTVGERREAKRQHNNTTEASDFDRSAPCLAPSPFLFQTAIFLWVSFFFKMNDSRSRLPSNSNYYPTVSELLNTPSNDLATFTKAQQTTLQCLLPDTISFFWSKETKWKVTFALGWKWKLPERITTIRHWNRDFLHRCHTNVYSSSCSLGECGK